MFKGKYLITTDQYFQAPNGNQYNSAWGEVEVLTDDSVGIKTNRNSTNWYAKIGSKERHVIVAGCQIHYAVKCETKPTVQTCRKLTWNSKRFSNHVVPSTIYIAE